MMNRPFKIVTILLLIFAMMTPLYAKYDKGKVRKAMMGASKYLKALNKAVENGDFYDAAVNLMDIAKEFKSLDDIEPLKGTQEEWRANHDELIDNAFKAIGACGDKDMDALQQYIKEIYRLYKEGHKKFR